MARHRLAKIAIGALIASSLVVVVAGQTSKPTFEVASVKKRIGPGPTSLTQGQGARPGGAFDMVNITVARFIMYAYDVRDYQVVGGPDWVRTDRFDIAARAGRDVPTPEIRLMLQSLLEDRFTLTVRTEQREMPIYSLVLARSDGRLGPSIKPSADPDCRQTQQRPSNVPPGAATSIGCGQMALIARSASTRMGAPVIDRTGLTGPFEYFMYLSPGLPLSAGGTILPPPDPSADPSLPSYPTALQEQLGLKLEATRGPVDVLVIDSVRQPTGN